MRVTFNAFNFFYTKLKRVTSRVSTCLETYSCFMVKIPFEESVDILRSEENLHNITLALGCSFVVPSILAITRDSTPRKCLASLLYVGSRAWQWPHHGA